MLIVHFAILDKRFKHFKNSFVISWNMISEIVSASNAYDLNFLFW